MRDHEAQLKSLKEHGLKFERRNNPFGAEAYAVDLSGAKITDKLLSQVTTLGTIAELNLSGSTLSDSHAETLEKLGLCNNAAKLNFSNTALSDAGLAKLKFIHFLQEMDLTGTKVTPEGVADFKKRIQGSSSFGINPKIKL